MYFSRIRLSPLASQSRAFWDEYGGDTYPTHELIWKFFADDYDRKRDFLYRYESIAGLPGFYCVSARQPLGFSGIWEIVSKPYDPQLVDGQYLQFDLRANPVKKRSIPGTHGEKERIVRHDVVMAEKKRMGYKDLSPAERPSEQEIVHRAGLAWLMEKGGNHGFAIEAGTVRVGGYRRQSFHKRTESHPISFSTLEFSGMLRVEDVDLFTRTLFEGIGPSKGFGCGLLMVKPAATAR